MIEIAKIKSLKGRRAILACGDADGCKSCAGKGFCSVKTRTFEALIEDDISVQVGDQVKVHLPGGQTVFSAFLVMIVPLLLFMAGYILGGRIFGVVSEGAKVLIGLAGLSGGFGLSFVYSKKRNSGEKGMPRVIGPA